MSDEITDQLGRRGILGRMAITAGRQALIEAYQCWACHKVLGFDGRPIYPDLSTVKEWRSSEWENSWLHDPQAIIPVTFMSTFGFSEAEGEAITDYLYE